MWLPSLFLLFNPRLEVDILQHYSISIMNVFKLLLLMF